MPLPPNLWTVTNRDQWDEPELMNHSWLRCTICLDLWPSSDSLERHEASCIRKRYACWVDECNAAFLSKRDARDHHLFDSCPKRLNEDPCLQDSNCYLCHTGFPTRPAYRKHLLTRGCKLRTDNLLRAIKPEKDPVSFEFLQAVLDRSLIILQGSSATPLFSTISNSDREGVLSDGHNGTWNGRSTHGTEYALPGLDHQTDILEEGCFPGEVASSDQDFWKDSYRSAGSAAHYSPIERLSGTSM